MNRLIQHIKLSTGLARPTKLALIVRADLKLSKGKAAAQCAHAAIQCYQQAFVLQPVILKEWLATGQPKIVLRINDLDELNAILRQCSGAGIIAETIRDAGRTQVVAGTITVLGVGPHYESDIDSIVKHLKLL